MSNILDYLDWRDITFKQDKFNEVDNLILSRIAYFPLDNIVPENEKIILKYAYENLENKEKPEIYLQREDKDLFFKLAKSKRFGRILLSDYINIISQEEEKQFSALTIELPDGTMYISYRGTDNTIVGWKEDLNMSFQDLVPSQIEAVNYLEKIAKKTRKQIRIGGHSKGGNLAVYAAAFCNINTKRRILEVYNNDGPGFQNNVIKSKEYKEITSRIHTYLPQTSIIGRLLTQKGKNTIIKSTQTGIMQHDLYSWQVLGNKFVKSEFTNASQFIDNTITEWLKEVSVQKREKTIDIIFEILNATGVKTLSEMNTKRFSNAKTILMTYKNIDSESKKIVLETLKVLLKIAIKRENKVD